MFSIEKWKHPERLLKVVTLLATYRDDIDTSEEMDTQIHYLNQKYGSDIRLLKTPIMSIPSSEIRDNVKELESFLPEKVAAYIRKHQLY